MIGTGHRYVGQPTVPPMPVRTKQKLTPEEIAAKKADILARAKKNAAAFSEDTTKDELEEAHGHPEENIPAVTGDQRAGVLAHPHNASHVAEELKAEEDSFAQTIEDLMVKGYEPHLPYERDFVAEGMDMIGRFI